MRVPTFTIPIGRHHLIRMLSRAGYLEPLTECTRAVYPEAVAAAFLSNGRDNHERDSNCDYLNSNHPCAGHPRKSTKTQEIISLTGIPRYNPPMVTTQIANLINSLCARLSPRQKILFPIFLRCLRQLPEPVIMFFFTVAMVSFDNHLL